MNKLPNKKSDLLILALEDYFKIKEDPKYEINMLDWHILSVYNPICMVCLAGSVIAKSLNCDRDITWTPNMFNPYVRQKLHIINDIRSGYIFLPDFDKFPNIDEEYQFNKDIAFYKDPELFENYIQDVIGILQAEGL